MLDNQNYPRRGEMYYVNQNMAKYFSSISNSSVISPKSGRPAIVVSRDEDNRKSPTIMVVFLTHKFKDAWDERPSHPTSFEVEGDTATQGKISVCCTNQVCTVDQESLGRYIRTLTHEELEMLDIKLRCALGIMDKNPSDSGTNDTDLQKYKEQIVNLTAKNSKLEIQLELLKDMVLNK